VYFPNCRGGGRGRFRSSKRGEELFPERLYRRKEGIGNLDRGLTRLLLLK